MTQHQTILSHALNVQDIAIEEIDDGTWNIVYKHTLLSRIDNRTAPTIRITDRA